jgi:hypothetical protein
MQDYTGKTVASIGTEERYGCSALAIKFTDGSKLYFCGEELYISTEGPEIIEERRSEPASDAARQKARNSWEDAYTAFTAPKAG